MSLTIDRQSLLVDAPGSMPLEELERLLSAEGLTLGLAATPGTPVGEWLAAGAPGAAAALGDPADHLVAGLGATLTDGRLLEILPGPRRATGPDLTALFLGAGGRFGTIDRAWLRVHVVGARRVALPLPRLDLDPPVSPGEAALLDRIAAELARP